VSERTELASANEYAERSRAMKPQILWVEALCHSNSFSSNLHSSFNLEIFQEIVLG